MYEYKKVRIYVGISGFDINDCATNTPTFAEQAEKHGQDNWEMISCHIQPQHPICGIVHFCIYKRLK